MRKRNNNDVVESNKLLLINLASKISQRIIEDDEELEELGNDEVISFINDVLENDIVVDRLLSSANNVYSMGDLETIIFDNNSLQYVENTVRSYLVRTNRLM